MFDIIQLTKETEFYRQRILSALQNINDDQDSQLYDLAKLFAQMGDAKARQAMYDYFIANIKRNHANGRALIGLDGLNGFLFVANAIGTRVWGDDWENDGLLRDVEERFGIETVGETIKRASKSYPKSKAFVNAVLKKRLAGDQRPQRVRPDPAGLTYAKLKPQISKSSYKALAQWGKEAGEVELNQAAADLLRETDERWVKSALFLFYQRSFPLDYGRLIELTEHEDYTLSKRAFTVLGNIDDVKIRQLALKIMGSDKPKGDAIGLLVKNFQQGDHALVEAFLPKLFDADEQHVAGYDAQDFYAAHPNSDSEARAMLTLYEHGPCTSCREKFVKRLMELNALPDWVSEECRYDANLDIRALVMRENGSRQP